MKNLTHVVIATLLFAGACTSEKPKEEETSEAVEKEEQPINVTLNQTWKTDTTSLITPESVLHDTVNNVLYVSCINGVPPSEKDGDGYIAKVSPEDGSIVEAKWVTGLSAPKGMGIYDGKLYVSDIKQLAVIDISTGTIVDTYSVDSAEFLNDIAIDNNGAVYISDSNINRIYKLEDEKITVWTEDANLGGPNGLFHDGEKMMVATFQKGNFNEIDTTTKKATPVVEAIPGGDGVVKVGLDYIVSNWNGEVFYVTSDYRKKKILDTKEVGDNAADIDYIEDDKLLLVPTFFGNSVVAYKVVQQ